MSCPSNCNHRQAKWGKGSRSASSPRSRTADDARIDLVTAFARFLEKHPAYSATSALDELRAAEYGRLESRRSTSYLDYTGGGLHADSQIREHARLLGEHVFGNPHSANPSSTPRRSWSSGRAPRYSPTSTAPASTPPSSRLNASGALKLVGESYPFEAGGRLLLDSRQPQLGQRHPRVRERERCRRRLRSADGAGPAHRRLRHGRAPRAG